MQSLREPNRNYITEAVIGSLPAALPPDERQRILASTPLSSTLNKLGSLRHDTLASPTLQGQRLRRSALKGALLVFITAGLPGAHACISQPAWHACTSTYARMHVSTLTLQGSSSSRAPPAPAPSARPLATLSSRAIPACPACWLPPACRQALHF